MFKSSLLIFDILLSSYNIWISSEIWYWVLSETLSIDLSSSVASNIVILFNVIIPSLFFFWWRFQFVSQSCLSLFNVTMCINNILVNTKVRNWVLSKTLSINLSSNWGLVTSLVIILFYVVIPRSFSTCRWSL